MTKLSSLTRYLMFYNYTIDQYIIVDFNILAALNIVVQSKAKRYVVTYTILLYTGNMKPKSQCITRVHNICVTRIRFLRTFFFSSFLKFLISCDVSHASMFYNTHAAARLRVMQKRYEARRWVGLRGACWSIVRRMKKRN